MANKVRFACLRTGVNSMNPVMLKGVDIIISPFNAVWYVFAAAFLGLCIPVYFLLRNKPREYRRKALLTIASANLALFVLYQLWFQYIPGTAFWGWHLLPINLCNIITVLLVVALATDNRHLYGFCFYVGTVAGIAAIMSPEGGLKDMQLFAPLMMGFYVVHCMLYMLGISLVSLKLYRPGFKNALWTVVGLEALTAVIYVVNLILRATVDPQANYFFLFETGGSPYLETLHSIAPVPPFTMMVSVLPVAVAAFLLITLLYKLWMKLGEKSKRLQNHIS